MKKKLTKWYKKENNTFKVNLLVSGIGASISKKVEESLISIEYMDGIYGDSKEEQEERKKLWKERYEKKLKEVGPETMEVMIKAEKEEYEIKKCKKIEEKLRKAERKRLKGKTSDERIAMN